MTFKEYLKKLGACKADIEWVGHKTRQEAWNDCQEPDWMLWLIGEEKLLDNRQLRLLAADFAEEALPLFETEYPN